MLSDKDLLEIFWNNSYGGHEDGPLSLEPKEVYTDHEAGIRAVREAIISALAVPEDEDEDWSEEGSPGGLDFLAGWVDNTPDEDEIRTWFVENAEHTAWIDNEHHTRSQAALHMATWLHGDDAIVDFDSYHKGMSLYYVFTPESAVEPVDHVTVKYDGEMPVIQTGENSWKTPKALRWDI